MTTGHIEKSSRITSILDAVFQVCIWGTLSEINHKQNSVLVPYMLSGFQVIDQIPENLFVRVNKTGKSNFSLILLSKENKVIGKIENLEFKEMPSESSLRYYEPVWKKVPLEAYSCIEKEKSKNPVLCISTQNDLSFSEHLMKKWSGNEWIDIIFEDGQWLLKQENDNEFEVKNLENVIKEFYLWEKVDICFLATDTVNQRDNANFMDLEDTLECGLYAFSQLLKALVNMNPFMGIQINLFTRNVYDIQMDQESFSYHSALIGFSKTLSREYKNISVTHIDLDCDIISDRILDHLNGESRFSEKDIAVRSEDILIREFDPIADLAPEKDRLRENGVYLIIGGAGGIGKLITEELVNIYSAKVIIVGRSHLTEELKYWLQGINRNKGEVQYLKYDISIEGEFSKIVSESRSMYGEINGVFHTAIVLEDKVFSNMDNRTIDKVLRPKVHGILGWEKVLKGINLDFIAIFSSAQSFTCSPGQSNYAGASTFLDNYSVHMQKELSCPVKIINWGYWGEVGRVATKEYKERLAEIGLFSISNEMGVKAFKSILNSYNSQIICINANDNYLKQVGIIEELPELDRVSRALREIKNMVRFDYSIVNQMKSMVSDFNEFIVKQIKDYFFNFFVTTQLEYVEIEKLPLSFQISDRHIKLFNYYFYILLNENYLIEKNGRIYLNYDLTNGNESSAKVDINYNNLLEKYPEEIMLIELLSNLHKNWGSLFTNEINVASLLFPNGSTKLMEQVYRGNSVQNEFNKSIAYFIQEVLNSGIENDYNILEVGAGTGSTSMEIFPFLEQMVNRTGKYLFTDISQEFLNKAREKWGGNYSFLEFGTMDINDIYQSADENIIKQKYDIILGTNVFHVAKSVSNAMDELKNLLKPGGFLIVNEATMANLYTTSIFGFTSGWWNHNDDLRIDGSPFLSLDSWINILEEKGFTNIQAMELLEETDFPQNIIVASLPEDFDDYTTVTRAIKTEVKRNPANSNRAVDYPMDEIEVIDKINSILGKILKMDVQEIHPDVTFDQYGVDSLVILEFHKVLLGAFNSFTTAVLYERTTVRSLATFLMTEYEKETDLFVGRSKSSKRDFKEPIELISSSKSEKSSSGHDKKDLEDVLNGMPENLLDEILSQLENIR